MALTVRHWTAPRRIVSLVLAGAFALPATSAWAKRENESPDPKAWLKQVLSGDALDLTGFPHRIIFVKSLPSRTEPAPVFMDIDVAAFNQLGFFEAVDSKSVAWDYKLNRGLAKKNPLAVIMNLSKADTMVLASEKGPWEFIRLVKGKRKVLAKAEGPSEVSAEGVYNWLPVALGWDGVVLGQQDDYLLVASTSKILAAPEIQALAVKESATTFSLPESRKGAGLLSLSRINAALGVFDIVFLEQGVKTLPPGTKLIIEKKTKTPGEQPGVQ